MSKLMLIDSTHPEETRVAVVSKGQIEDFDFVARHKRQLRGNIYLANITRVEPALQAAAMAFSPSARSIPIITRSRRRIATP